MKLVLFDGLVVLYGVLVMQAHFVKIYQLAVLAQQRNAEKLITGKEVFRIDENFRLLEYSVVTHGLLVEPEFTPVPAWHQLSSGCLSQLVQVHRCQRVLLHTGSQHPLCPVRQRHHVQIDNALGLAAKVEDGVEAVLVQIVYVDFAAIVVGDCEIFPLLVESEVEVVAVGFLLVKKFRFFQFLIIEVKNA